MSTVLLEAVRPGVALLTLNRPERLNAMSHELIEDVHDALDEVGADTGTRVLVVTGAGRGFCAGLDLKGAGEAPGAAGLGRPQASLSTCGRCGNR
jgi:enoyl-CoA hydratase